jgi:ribosomal protein S6--L-glutamate ligase
MGIRLVYGLKTTDQGYLEAFYPSRRLAEAARERRLDYQARIFEPNASPDDYIPFCRNHAAILRGELPLSLYEALENEGIPVVNSSASTELARDKMASSGFFVQLGVLHPRTKALDHHAAEAPLGWPFVAKPRYGRMGWGVLLIGDRDDWNSMLESDGFKDNEYIAQEYIAASRGIDVRFFFAAFDCRGLAGDSRFEAIPTPGRIGTASVCVIRRNKGFLSNAHTGGTMETFEAPDSLRAVAERIFIASGLDYGTVDFLVGNAEWTRFPVCEMNANPGFEELERASGFDVAGAILASALARNTADDRNGGKT